MKQFLIILLVSGYAFAEQKYNPHSNTWETVRPEAELQYNPIYTNQYKYVAAPDACAEIKPIFR